MKKVFYINVDIYIEAETEEEAEEIAIEKLESIADQSQDEPYIINETGPTNDSPEEY